MKQRLFTKISHPPRLQVGQPMQLDVRGARSHCGRAVKSAPEDLVRAETGLQSMS